MVDIKKQGKKRNVNIRANKEQEQMIKETMKWNFTEILTLISIIIYAISNLVLLVNNSNFVCIAALLFAGLYAVDYIRLTNTSKVQDTFLALLIDDLVEEKEKNKK